MGDPYNDDAEDVFFDWEQFKQDIPPVVRMMDNVIDRTIYPLPEQETEAKNKRRMGLGITGLANAAEFLGYSYGSSDMLDWMEKVMTTLRDECYKASIELAKEKGPFPLYSDDYIGSRFLMTLPTDIVEDIMSHGIRNSHLLSIAPTGTISLWAGNISSGIEPVFAHEYDRTVFLPNGEKHSYEVWDYAWSEWGLKGKTSAEVTAQEHINVLCMASKYVDSACSKTCNVGDNISFDEFQNLYRMAYQGGASGCTTFRPTGLLKGVLNAQSGSIVFDEPPHEVINEGGACFIDPITGERSCAD